jgi:hypothetical protein
MLEFTQEEFEIFIATNESAPSFVSGVLSCPGCFSAYVAAAGAVVASLSIGFHFWIALAWAGGAWAGHKLYEKL